MNRRNFLGTLSAVPLAEVVNAVESTPAPSSDGFVPIFNGHDLDGWTIAEGPESAFSVADGAIVVNDSASYPTWLRSNRQYENFDFRAEFYMKGWVDSGIYLHAPENRRPTWVGMQMKLFHQAEEKPMSNAMGSIFPLIAPRKVNVKSNGEWNDIRILMDWPSLRVWTNGELIQDLNVEDHPELRHRFPSSGYLRTLPASAYPHPAFPTTCRSLNCLRRIRSKFCTALRQTSMVGTYRRTSRTSSPWAVCYEAMA